jgi:hypothetical protein
LTFAGAAWKVSDGDSVGGPADKTNSAKENTPPIAQEITQ